MIDFGIFFERNIYDSFGGYFNKIYFYDFGDEGEGVRCVNVVFNDFDVVVFGNELNIEGISDVESISNFVGGVFDVLNGSGFEVLGRKN